MTSRLSETLMPATGIATVFGDSVENLPLIPSVEKVVASEPHQGSDNQAREQLRQNPNHVVYEQNGQKTHLEAPQQIIDTLG